MLKNINDMLEYYDCFNSYILKWYNSALSKGELHYEFDSN